MKLTSLLSFLNAVFCPALLLTWLCNTPRQYRARRRAGLRPAFQFDEPGRA